MAQTSRARGGLQVSDDEEQRRYQRVRTQLLAGFADPARTAEVLDTDISERGMFVETSEPAPVGKTLSIALSSEQDPEPVYLLARVVRVVKPSPGDAATRSGMALDFVEVPPQQSLRLRRLVRTGDAAKMILLIRPSGGATGGSTADLLNRLGYEVIEASGTDDPVGKEHPHGFATLVVDVSTKGDDWTELVGALRRDYRGTPVVLITAERSEASAVRAASLGVLDTVRKPIDIGRLARILGRAVAAGQGALGREARTSGDLPELIKESDAMTRLWEEMEVIAPARSMILLHGEPGSGKHLVAQWLHRLSACSDGPFVTGLCETITPDDINRGVTGLGGRIRPRWPGKKLGFIGRAAGGTLVLDEITNLDERVLTRLITMLGRIEASRSARDPSSPRDVRIIATTRLDPHELGRVPLFRKKMFYQLDPVSLTVPPLRERSEDLLPLAYALLDEICAGRGLPKPSFESTALGQMRAYIWPGNVRELRNVLERSVVDGPGPVLRRLELPAAVSPESIERASRMVFDDRLPWRIVRKQVGNEYFRRLLARFGGNILHAAKAAGIAPKNLRQRLDVHNINSDDYRRLGSGDANVSERGIQGEFDERLEKTPGERPRILVIDDRHDQREALARILRRDYDVVLAQNGDEALEALEGLSEVSLILCDVIMPDGGGAAVYERICKAHPELEDRFAFLTGYHASRETDEFLRSTGRPVAFKPIHRDAVAQLIIAAKVRRDES